jgi:3-deoxy-manno-octulosonate cytidylyltransferase (CMP-KDO synthetase)
LTSRSSDGYDVTKILLAIVAIIPARYGSTRLPGKPLSDIHGKPMIERVYERVRRARGLDRILVATDDERISAVVRSFNGEVVMTSPEHRTGTDRLAEVVRDNDAAVVVNVQGDEPLVDPDAIEAALAPILADPGLPMATLSVPIAEVSEMLSPAVVKVVTDAHGDALYFSRGVIPWPRGVSAGDAPAAARIAVEAGLARKHVGVYVYRRDILLRLAALPAAPLEQLEGLEQLRALHHGARIRVVHRATAGGPAVDTPEDLERVRALVGSAG